MRKLVLAVIVVIMVFSLAAISEARPLAGEEWAEEVIGSESFMSFLQQLYRQRLSGPEFRSHLILGSKRSTEQGKREKTRRKKIATMAANTKFVMIMLVMVLSVAAVGAARPLAGGVNGPGKKQPPPPAASPSTDCSGND
ncbi:hypothetical protein PR202_gb09759 [Eleusine coracana subsp. coracana]|uniref:Transmembrane protein n=1 Tax=Eleusine coracana subsp. coracana TaxID=191504 RepID=A0AAV5EI12_ELECO|nr:hypothetical protein PR202_gb09759 [Eleusine coracana subsp. coracana]